MSSVLSAIIVNYNTGGLTCALIDSLRMHIRKYPPEIIVVDNHSTDGSAWYLRQNYADIALIEFSRNHGFGRAVNAAADRCTGKFLWLINSDCMVDTDIAAGMVEHLEEHSDTAAVAARLMGEDGSFQASCRRFPTFGNVLFSRQSPLSFIPGSKGRYTLPDYDSPTVVEACACSCVMIRREQFDAVGGFDPRFFMYCEDTDLCLRFAERGWKVVYLPNIEVKHLWARSWAGRGWLRYYHHHRSIIRYFRKHFANRRVRLLFLEIALTIGLGVRMIQKILGRRA